jgi:hypothetical protein
MGRLIDDETLKQELYQQWFMDILLTQKRSDDMFYALAQKIDAQPTAYDPDEVVEQLEERTAFLKDCTKYGNKTTDQQSKSYDTMMMYEVKDLVDDLLEIVKAGGVDGN